MIGKIQEKSYVTSRGAQASQKQFFFNLGMTDVAILGDLLHTIPFLKKKKKALSCKLSLTCLNCYFLGFPQKSIRLHFLLNWSWRLVKGLTV